MIIVTSDWLIKQISDNHWQSFLVKNSKSKMQTVLFYKN